MRHQVRERDEDLPQGVVLPRPRRVQDQICVAEHGGVEERRAPLAAKEPPPVASFSLSSAAAVTVPRQERLERGERIPRLGVQARRLDRRGARRAQDLGGRGAAQLPQQGGLHGGGARGGPRVEPRHEARVARRQVERVQPGVADPVVQEGLVRLEAQARDLAWPRGAVVEGVLVELA